MQPYVKTAYLSWYSIGESNTVEPVPKPLQEGGSSHAAHECNMKCNIITVNNFVPLHKYFLKQVQMNNFGLEL